MADVFERLHKLKGKTREEIVAGSAHAEWATTDLFVQNTGRQGTGKLAEIVLAKCGQSQEDAATPLLDAALELRDTTAVSTEERAAILKTRIAAADALSKNRVP